MSRVKGNGAVARIAARLRVKAACREADPHAREDRNVTGVTTGPPRIHLPLPDAPRGKRHPRAGWGN